MDKFEKLKELKMLFDEGILTQDEYENEKKRILSDEFNNSTTYSQFSYDPNVVPPTNITINKDMSAKSQYEFRRLIKKYRESTKADLFNEDDEIVEAKLFAQAVELQLLKAPSTAVFCDLELCNITKLGAGYYMITGFVNSENSYSAKIKTDYSLKVIKIKGCWYSADHFVDSSTAVITKHTINYVVLWIALTVASGIIGLIIWLIRLSILGLI